MKFAASKAFPQRPAIRRVNFKIDERNAEAGSFLQTCRRGEPGMFSIRNLVKERERYIFRVPCENLRCVEAAFLFGASLRRARAEFAQDCAAPLTDDFSVISYCRKDTSDCAGCIVGNRTIGDGEMRLLRKI